MSREIQIYVQFFSFVKLSSFNKKKIIIINTILLLLSLKNKQMNDFCLLFTFAVEILVFLFLYNFVLIKSLIVYCLNKGVVIVLDTGIKKRLGIYQ